MTSQDSYADLDDFADLSEESLTAIDTIINEALHGVTGSTTADGDASPGAVATAEDPPDDRQGTPSVVAKFVPRELSLNERHTTVSAICGIA